MEKENRYLRMIGFISLCLFMLFSASACGNDTEAETRYAQSPQDVVQSFMTAQCENDIQTQYNALGIIGMTNIREISISNFQIRKLTGEDFNETLEDITKYWLNDDNGWEFAYNAFDISEIGYVSFTMIDEISGESQDVEDFCIVKTDLGWFIAVPSM